MVRKTVPDGRSGDAEALFAEFHRSSRHGQISTFCRTERRPAWLERFAVSTTTCRTSVTPDPILPTLYELQAFLLLLLSEGFQLES